MVTMPVAKNTGVPEERDNINMKDQIRNWVARWYTYFNTKNSDLCIF
jgi:hypothetical protein